MARVIFAFDLYGTLLSTESIADALAGRVGTTKAKELAVTWRREQLQYTWRLNSMKQYEDFETVTRKSFLHAMAEHQVSMDDKDINSVLLAYDGLATFPDVDPALDTLTTATNASCVIFSNGTRKMMTNSVNGSGNLSAKAAVFSELISVDHVRSFKPAPEVYRYLRHCVQGAGLEGDLYLVSSNPFDVVGARSAGLEAIWVDRTGQGWKDKLGHEPTQTIKDLGELTGLIPNQDGD